MANRTGVQFFAKVLIGAASGGFQRFEDDLGIASWEFEDNEDTADKLKLDVNNFDLRNFDNPIFADGNIIEFSFGYEGRMSLAREAIITKVTGGTMLKVEALAKSFLLNKIPRTRIFEKVRRSDVAKQIAEEYGYSGSSGPRMVDIEDTAEVLPQITQARMTDANLIRQLAEREGFVWYMDATGFHFHKRRPGQPPKMKLVYYTSTVGDIMSFSIESDLTAKPSVVVAKGFDSMKKKEFMVAAATAAALGGGATGAAVAAATVGLAPIVPEGPKVAPDTGEITPNTAAPNASGHAIATTERTEATAQRQVEGIRSKAQSSVMKMKLSCVGNPDMMAKSVIEIGGLGRALSGNYYVTKVTHKRKADYTMDLEVRRDGRSAGAGTPAQAKVNTAKAPDTPSDELVERTMVDPETGEKRKIFVDARGQQK